MIRNWIGKSIAYKLTALLSVVVVMTFGIVLYLYVSFGKEFVYRSSGHQSTVITKTVYDMLQLTGKKGHLVPPKEIIEEIAEASGVDYITLYDNEGRPVLSSRQSEQQPLNSAELARLRSLDYDHSITEMSAKTIDYTAPIRIYASCQQCHEAGDGLGFVRISSYYSRLYSHTYHMAKKFGALFLSIVILFIIVSLYIVELIVVRPLNRFTGLIHRAETNNFLPRAISGSKDEIGEMENSFNFMLSRITQLMASSVEKERELISAKEELKYKDILMKRSKELEQVNRELEESIKELSTLYNFAQYTVSIVDMNELLRIITTTISETLNYKECAILLKEGSVLRTVSAWGFDDSSKLIGIEFANDEGISGYVASTGKPVLINDTGKETRYLHYKGQKKAEGSFMSLPLKYKDNVIGVLNVSNNIPNSFTKKDMDFLVSICAQIAVVIENSRLYEKTKELSITDDLTGMFNRRYMRAVLDKEWERAKRYGKPLSLLMMDVDYFKNYNDTFGHLKGDEALVTLSHIFKMNIRGIDTIVRYGGEEFMVILPDTDPEGAMAVAEKLRSAVAGAFRQGDSPQLTVSIGVVSSPCEGIDNVGELLYAADIALYQAKKKGRNKIMEYENKYLEEDNG
ncbi:MAG: diguanylate cyclase [Deltaproteobacteria bacterium]|nr:diguanylate cyclase [Deltaproteobacteria bacterium]MCL5276486.1 diguanylate cyclase [Deltaproteobacteria bacterium]